MTRLPSQLLIAGFFIGGLYSQETHMPEFHGFLTQGFVYSGNNNYLGMNTSSGTPDWTEAAVNINEEVTDKLRVGVQMHTTKFGQFGSWTPVVDWALADYKLKPWLGVRAGRVKIRWGLYNDTQDADPGYLWSLLPEPMYALDWRTTNLSQMGGELYGHRLLGRKRGELEYSTYYGYYFYAAHDGYMEGFQEQGLTFSKRPGGITPGFDLRWKTPVRGLKIGGSLMLYNAHGTLVNGTYRQPITYWPTYYAQYDKRKLFLSAQYMRLAQPTYITTDGVPSYTWTDNRGWFAMAGYHVTSKLQLGVYHTRNVLASAYNPSDSANHFRDYVVSSRYDINAYFYTKLEGHYIDGNGLGFYGFDNPDGLKPQTKVLVAKIGFCF